MNTHQPGSEAQEALRISESRYRRLFETARDGILLLNAETAQLEDVNPYLIEMLGFSHDEFLGKKLWEAGAFADTAESKEMFAVLQREGYVRYDDMPLKTASGGRLEVEFVSNSYDVEGIKVIQCNVRDITDRVRADAALREYKSIVDASDDAIISKMLDGTIKSWNPGAERLFGYTADEAIGQTMSLIIPPDRPNEEAEILARMALGEAVDHFETVRRCKDGHPIAISVTMSPIFDKAGKLIAASKIARDITERRRAEAAHDSLEAQLHEAQKLEAIGTLAGGIAHDFNNILAAILGNAELAIEDTKGNVLAQQSIEEIRKAGRRARDLVQQILSFSRRQPIELKRLSLVPVVEESVRMMRRTFPAACQVKIECVANVPDVMADATQIEQALLNLATNAMQAARGCEQTIEVCLDTVMLDAAFADEHPALRSMHLTQPARTVRLTVRDDGPGMDPTTLAHIFEPFFTTKPMGEGTGLGLSVVRGILQSHGGAIMVESQPGEGATFTMYLPVATDKPVARVKSPSDTGTHTLRDGKGCRLLYIDDDEGLVYLASRQLQRRGYEVTAFADARVAIERLRSDPSAFDIVVTDYNMPYVSGLDVARAVRIIRPDLPVAIVSGFIDEQLLSQAKEAGVHELIMKATDITEFGEALHRLASGLSVKTKSIA